MHGSKRAPTWLPYALLTALLGGFIYLAFHLMDAVRVWTEWLLADTSTQESVSYIVFAMYCVGVLVMLPLLGRRLLHCDNAAVMVSRWLTTLGWQCAACGGLAVLYALSPLGEWRLFVTLLPVGIALLCARFVLRKR